jgi:hypothetical protein
MVDVDVSVSVGSGCGKMGREELGDGILGRKL